MKFSAVGETSILTCPKGSGNTIKERQKECKSQGRQGNFVKVWPLDMT